MKKLITTVIKTMIFFIGWVLMAGLLPIPDSSNDAIWRLWAEVLPFLYLVGFTIIFWLIDKKRVRLNLISSPFKNSILGLGSGIAWLGITTVILLISGTMKVVGMNTVPMIWLWIISVFINSIMQELLVRGYLYQMIKSKYNIIAATIVTTALFTLMHGGAFEAGIIPVMNVLTMSILMTVVLEYTRSLIAPIFMHFIWNSIGAVILGGVSLAEDYPNLLITEFTGNPLLSGGAPKMEGSIIVLIVNVIFIIGFITLIKKKNN